MEIVLGLISKYPIISTILMVLGALRVVMKSVVSFLQKYVKTTPSLADDQKLQRVLESGLYRAISFGVDLLLSLKLPKAESLKKLQ